MIKRVAVVELGVNNGFVYLISSSGNDIEVFLVDDHHVFDNIYYVRRNVRSADKQVDHCYQLYQAYQIHITCIRLSEVVSFYCMVICHLHCL